MERNILMMSSFSSLLDQFKVTSQQVSVLPTEQKCPASNSNNKKRPHSTTKHHENVSKHHDINNNSWVDTSSLSQRGQSRYRLPTIPVRTIFIACPAGAETGGPEALHQLCHMINVGKYTPYSSCPDIVVAAAAAAAVNNNIFIINSDNNNNNMNNNRENYHDNDHHPTIEIDEFGRECKTTQHTTINDSDHELRGKEDEDMPTKPTLRAYMLYLRESTTKSGRVVVEHIPSARARSIKYDKYLAPPAMQLPGSTTSLLVNQGSRLSDSEEEEEEEYSSELVIWPECWTNLIDSLQPVEIDEYNQHDKQQLGCRSIANRTNDRKMKYQIAIWWLSVNNNNGQFTLEQFVTRRDVLHLVQSAYAREYVLTRLQRHGVNDKGATNGENDHHGFSNNVLSLTEFIPYSSPTFSSGTSDDDDNDKTRDLDVVYNPAKGMHYTDEIIRRICGGGKKAKTINWNDGGGGGGNRGGGSIQFTPIGKGLGGRERMTGEEVVDLLRRSKVYIDFGPHPGMDRLPREAALAGCVVITNCEGAANFNEDVPLPSEFKFRSFDVEQICQLLREICANHAAYTEKMKPYCQWILGQEKQMRFCVDQLVDNVVTRRYAKIAEEKTG